MKRIVVVTATVLVLQGIAVKMLAAGEVVANYIGTGRTVEEILKGVKTVLLQKPDSSKAFDSFLQKRKPGADINSPLSTREDGDEPTSPKVVANGTVDGPNQTRAAVDSTAVNGTVEESQSNGAGANRGAVEGEGWSEAQEVALVKATKAFPKDTANRWERIATAVPGKSKAQCFKKFAELRDNFRSTKKAE